MSNKLHRFDFVQQASFDSENNIQNKGANFYKLVPAENFDRARQEYLRAASVLGLTVIVQK